ncbi:AlkZ-related protein [Priestia koreensis]|uniref:AlkZ-related protein n=1 Tax=Priestia koreensis TaxID=284581 RepID=UPI003D042955
MNDNLINTYEEAKQVVSELGFLPLAPLFPEFPSLQSITNRECWYTDEPNDPWTWRTKFAADGVAAYGKFVKKKSILISKELFPLVQVLLGSEDSLKERYENGNLSKEALQLFDIIEANEGIDTRLLRTQAEMREKEKKKRFDQALVELQGNMDIVVSGIKEKHNELGEKKSWSSTSFETMTHWVQKNRVETFRGTKKEAKELLYKHFSAVTTPPAFAKFKKFFAL